MTDVRVMVYNAYTAQMVAGANVYLFDPMRGTPYSQNTDSSGIAYFYNLPSSRYSLSVARDGFKESNSEFAIGGDYFPVDVPLQPTGGIPPPNPPVVVDLGFLVVNAGGAPIQGAVVTLDNKVSQSTNSFGRALFLQVGIWTHTFKVTNSGYNQSTGTVDASKVVDQTVLMTLVSQPPPPPIVEHIVTVFVTNAALVPLSGITVTLAKTDGGYSSSKPTGLNGSAVFSRAPTGTYGVYVNNGAGTALEVTADVTVTYVLSAPPPPPPQGWTLTVQVLADGGTMLPGRCAISVYQGASFIAGATSENNGSQVFTNLTTGTYWIKVMFGPNEYSFPTFSLTGSMTKTVTLPDQGGGGEGTKKTYTILSNFGLEAMPLTAEVWVKRAFNIAYDPAKTQITAVTLRMTATSNTTSRVVEMFVNNADVGGVGWSTLENGSTPKTVDIDVGSQVVPGDNEIGYKYYVSFGVNAIGMKAVISSYLEITYTGVEPVITVKAAPWNLDWTTIAIIGGVALVGVLLLSRGGGGGTTIVYGSPPRSAPARVSRKKK